MYVSNNLKNPSVKTTTIKVGDFVTASNGLGVGKLVGNPETFCVIEYFDSPADYTRYQERAVTSKVSLFKLEPQMRVYFFDDEDGCWRFGRVEGHVDRTVYIALPNKRVAECSVEDVYVRWMKPIKDPWALLSEKLTETPFFHARRHELVRMFIKQRAGSMGMTGLISSSIELEDHQIEVIRKVLTDPVQRYLLADEVGLGKTIEAGVIVRQHILDRPLDHHVVIVVPPSLVSQWQDEMESRCQLSEVFGHSIEIISTEEVIWYMGAQPTFIVVDEAHQLTKGISCSEDLSRNDAFQKIKALSDPKVCSNLLLLSATPALRNEAGFLALLHLLDPLMYDLDDTEAFKLRVKNRQILADLFWSFTPDQDPMFLEGDVEQLRELFPADVTLLEMLDELNPLLESSDHGVESEVESAVSLIRTHLSETQRLHRRILRNRRNEDLLAVLPGRGSLFAIPYTNGRFLSAENCLDEWRSNAGVHLLNDSGSVSKPGFEAIYEVLLNALFGDVQAFLICLKIRLTLDSSIDPKLDAYGSLIDAESVSALVSTPHFDGEETTLSDILDSQHLLIEARDRSIENSLEWIPKLLQSIPKLVVMSSSPVMAQDVYDRLAEIDSTVVSRHSVQDNEWLQRWQRSGQQILVCDQGAEEGLNLQGGHCGLIHLDLPFSPNRIEQRLGRLDRFGSGSKIDSVVFQVKSSPLSKEWAHHLDKVWTIFSTSIASLQYLVDEEMQKLRSAVFECGHDAITETSRTLIESQAILNERNAIRNQDSLDSIEDNLSESDKERLDSLDDISISDLSRALNDWMVNGLHFKPVRDSERRDYVSRYRYCHTEGKRTLMASRDFLHWFQRSIDMESDYPDYLKPMTYPMAFSRQRACKNKIGVARLGQPLIEAVRKHIRWDDRGVSFAMWRCVPIGEIKTQSTMFFRLDFVVEANRNNLSSSASYSESNISSLERQADLYFPPIVETIWVDEDLNLPNESVMSFLNTSYNSYTDSNIRPEMWADVLKATSCEDWVGLCSSVRDISGARLAEMHQLPQKCKSSIESVSKQYGLIKSQLECRINSTSNVMESEKERLLDELNQAANVCETLEASIGDPTVRLDSAGLVILSNVSIEID